jgi:hypothetical protein
MMAFIKLSLLVEENNAVNENNQQGKFRSTLDQLYQSQE